MHLKLKEDVREWLKFAVVLAVVLGAVALWSWNNQLISPGVLAGMLVALSLFLIIGLFRPLWIRPVYRGGMTISFCVGQIVGRILLTGFFLCVLTPVGLLLRLARKDLLRIKRNSGTTSYWEPAKISDKFERMF